MFISFILVKDEFHLQKELVVPSKEHRLHYAAHIGDIETIKELVEAGYPPGNTL